MDTPRPNELYRQIAKDYNPKAAEMNICRYIQALERRVVALEEMIKKETGEENPAPAAKKGTKKNG